MNARFPRSAAVAAAGLAAALACSDTTGPLRSDIYEFRRFVGTGSGVDTLSFHWPGSSLPVKVWVQDRYGMPEHVRRGIALWEGAFLYGEYRAVLVADSTSADVIVQVPDGLPSPAGPGAAAPALRLRSSAPGCEGATDIALTADGEDAVVPFHVYVAAKFDPAVVDLSECFAITAAHEIGHSLGLLQHSPDPADLMYADPVVNQLSPRDVRTAEAAYHYPANLGPVRR